MLAQVIVGNPRTSSVVGLVQDHACCLAPCGQVLARTDLSVPHAWRWTRPLDVIQCWHCSRRPSRATGRKLSGRGTAGTWDGTRRNMPGMLALVGLPSLQNNDTYLELKLRRVPWGNYGQKQRETSFSPSEVFLVSHNLLTRFWRKILWHLWIGRARNPVPSLDNLDIDFLILVGFSLTVTMPWKLMLASWLSWSIDLYPLGLEVRGLG